MAMCLVRTLYDFGLCHSCAKGDECYMGLNDVINMLSRDIRHMILDGIRKVQGGHI